MAQDFPMRQLGKSGPSVTATGWGAMGLSAFYGPKATDEERLNFLDSVYQSGITFWDTSDYYGDSEELLGKWFARSGKRNEIFLATKFGAIEGGAPEQVNKSCKASLKRLGVDTIDLYYYHRMDRVTPIEKTVQAMADLKRAGMVRYLGLSECSATSIRRAYKIHPISAVQVEYSPFSMEIEDPKINVLQTCRELGVALVAYSPLGRGFLGGKFRSPDDFSEGDIRRVFPRFSAENFDTNVKLVEALEEVAQRKGVKISSLTLAWLLAQGEDIIPIPGTTKLENLANNKQSVVIQLSDDENREIREAIQRAVVVGSRYHQHAMASLFADTPTL
ncbi:putative Aldo-keto reductase (AKR13) [Venustampulla echinocandica]|uniref:Putative Aldo-keto reductase (AKR13) n=1 Tax=Venustampulla echinocandica TaxID=2656787 RepID=A0A370TSZ5_9HELO|nr:putative Aldo-keto reductase (AKR13) [Venustampulla echinocandica]RDL38647.1 putative Aldo-keto reductase (AKR13) [Venustampulla echinocandica]